MTKHVQKSVKTVYKSGNQSTHQDLSLFYSQLAVSETEFTVISIEALNASPNLPHIHNNDFCLLYNYYVSANNNYFSIPLHDVSMFSE